jgi:hypothetical protein
VPAEKAILSQKGGRRRNDGTAIGDRNRAGRARVISWLSLRIFKITRKNREPAALGIGGVEGFWTSIEPPHA